MCITYAMVGFELLSVSKAIAAYKNVYFLGHIIVPAIIVLDKILPKPMSQKKKAE
jgi:lysophospholipid acyltransferase 5